MRHGASKLDLPSSIETLELIVMEDEEDLRVQIRIRLTLQLGHNVSKTHGQLEKDVANQRSGMTALPLVPVFDLNDFGARHQTTI